MAIETANWAYDPHLHILLAGTNDQKPYIWKQKWYKVAGWAKITLYDPNLGASYYMGGKLIPEDVDIKFSKELQRIRIAQ
ncbi:hypothetical protein ACFLU8_00895 [Chloroflexota bacterium]